MMEHGDSRLTDSAFVFASTLRIIPVTFDGKTGRMRKAEGKNGRQREFLYKVWSILGSLHILYMSLRLLNSFIYLKDVSWDFVLVIMTLTEGYCSVSVISFILFQTSLEENIKVFNEIINLRGNFIKNPIVTLFKSKKS